MSAKTPAQASTPTETRGMEIQRRAPQARFWGKVRSVCVVSICVGKTAPAGWPKSNCAISKPQKYGATMAAQHRATADKYTLRIS
jgi:hypothetical protein